MSKYGGESMTSYTGKSGIKYTIDEKIGSGGEGVVYSLKPPHQNLVIKIYNAKKFNINSDKAKKINAMINYKDADKFKKNFAWPVDLINKNNNLYAIIMPKVEGIALSNFKNNKGVYWSKRITIAKNFCKLVTVAHENNQVIGDFNANNFIINIISGDIVMIDTDSLHFTDNENILHRCNVAHPEFTPPELIGKKSLSESKEVFSKESDNFVLAIHIFQLLMYGYHPFSAKLIKPGPSSPSTSNTTTNSYIKNAISPYLCENKNYTIPPLSPKLKEIIPETMIKSFKTSLIDGHKNPSKRISPKLWYAMLDDLENSLINCKQDIAHEYSSYFSDCPWCEQEKRIKQFYEPKKMNINTPLPKESKAIQNSYAPTPQNNQSVNSNQNYNKNQRSYKNHLISEKATTSLFQWGIAALVFTVIMILISTKDMGLGNLIVEFIKYYTPILIGILSLDFTISNFKGKSIKNIIPISIILELLFIYLISQVFMNTLIELELLWYSIAGAAVMHSLAIIMGVMINKIINFFPSSSNPCNSKNMLDLLSYIFMSLGLVSFFTHYINEMSPIAGSGNSSMTLEELPYYLEFLDDIFLAKLFVNTSDSTVFGICLLGAFTLLLLPELREKLNTTVYNTVKISLIFLGFALISSYLLVFLFLIYSTIKIIFALLITALIIAALFS